MDNNQLQPFVIIQCDIVKDTDLGSDRDATVNLVTPTQQSHSQH